MTRRLNLDYDSLFETVCTEEFQEKKVSDELFRRNLNDLVDIGLLERNFNEINDEVWYMGKKDLHFAEFSSIDDPLKKYILQQFISSPAMFFVLFNTQKGKSAITIQKIISWAQDPVKKIVPILMLESNIGLGDQTVQGIMDRMALEGVPVKLFHLVSTEKSLLVDSITNYIDSYVSFPEDKKPMPLIVALTNDKQLTKVLEVLDHITTRAHQRYSNLCYGLIWDEADRTYPMARDKKLRVAGKELCIRNFTMDNTAALGGCGWITATEGSLLDSEDFPECANAYAVIPEINEVDEVHYRAFHHKDAVLKNQKFSKNNNENFLKVFSDNKKHFMGKLISKDGKEYYRKTVINSSAKTADHTKLAKELNAQGCHAMTFNQNGLTVYSLDMQKHRLKTKGRSFNQLLMYAYKKCNLDTAPLFIIGRRKVDRGLSFHYAPRSYHSIKPKILDFELGPLELDGIEGLIWTDMVLGHVEIKESAVQKAGRLAGIIAHCPQYPGTLTWWTNEETGNEVKRHYELVDKMNSLPGCNTMVQAMARADRDVPVVPVRKTKEDLPSDRFNWSCKGATGDLFETFDTVEELNQRKKSLNTRSHSEQFKQNQDGFYECSTSTMSQKTIEDIRSLSKTSSNMPKGPEYILKKMAVGEVLMRGYVYYDEGELDKDKCKYALRWVKREA